MRWFIPFIFVLFLSSSLYGEEHRTYRIGVLAKRGVEKTLQRWEPTAIYLNQTLKPLRFEIVPLDFHSIHSTVEKNGVDFVLVNSAYYVSLQYRYHISRMVTMRNILSGDIDSPMFGGVVFKRSDRTDIKNLSDLRGKRFVAVDEFSLGGWLMALREMKRLKINPHREFKSLNFTGTHDSVVYAVLKGEADAGTVRTDTLERMASEGKIDLNDFAVIDEKRYEFFPLMISTDLYPEWPMAKLEKTPNEIARQVAIALMKMPRNSEAARISEIAGWTIPLDYTPVHECLRELRVDPYDRPEKISFKDVAGQYWPWFVSGVSFFAMAWIVTFYVVRLNVALKKRQREYEELNASLEKRVQDRTSDLKRFQWIADSSSDHMSYLTPDYIYREVNNIYLIAHQKERDEIVGHSVEDLHGRDFFHAIIKPNLDRCFKGEKVEYESWIEFPGLGIRYMHFSYNPFVIENGQVAGVVSTSHDITDRKNAEESLRQLSKSLEDRVKEEVDKRREQEHMLIQQSKMAAMGEMIGAIAHQWSQPLNSMALLIQDLKDAYECGEIDAQYISGSVKSSMNLIDFMSRTIYDFRNFLKPSRAKRPFPVKKAIDDVLGLISALFKDNNINVEYKIDSDYAIIESILTDGFENECKQVFLNILNNAKDAILNQRVRGILDLADSGEITIKMKKKGSNIIIQFQDNGGGMRPELVDKIFDPYFTTKGENGTGIGLSMAQTIIEKNMNGKIRARNANGGAVIEIELPCVS